MSFVAHHVFSNGFKLAHDDAFITYVYASNLAQGHGPVFNLVERIWGYTSPLHMLLLAGLGVLGVPIPPASLGLSIFLILPISLLFYLLLVVHGQGSSDSASPTSSVARVGVVLMM